MTYGALKRAVVGLEPGHTAIVPAYRRAEGGLRPSPYALRLGREFGYTLVVVGYAEAANKPVAILRRTA